MKASNQKHTSVLFLFVFCIAACSCSKKNDEPVPPIAAEPASITSTGSINGCVTSIGSGSMFYFVIPYKAPAGTVIDKFQYTIKASDGTKKDHQFNTTDGTDSFLNAGSCVRFGPGVTWVELTFILNSTNGLKSNPSTLRINRPAGAN